MALKSNMGKKVRQSFTTRDLLMLGSASVGALFGVVIPPAGIGTSIALKKEDGLLGAFGKGAGWGSIAGILAACAPPSESSRQPEFNSITLSPRLAFYITVSGIKLPDEPNARQNLLAELDALLSKPEQADEILGTLVSNQISIDMGNIATEQAYAEGRVIEINLCSDARGWTKSKVRIPSLSFGEPNAERDIFLVENRQAGTQPVKVRNEIKKSAFITHEVIPSCEVGTTCGYLGGIEQALLKGDDEARIILAQHKVPSETIDGIIAWKNKYAGEFDLQGNFGGKTGRSLAEEWAKVGGRIQAFINGEGHLVAIGLQTNAEGKVEILGYVNGKGQMFLPDQRPVGADDLAGAIEFLNQPHPRLDSFLKQIPNTNIVSVSQFSPQAMFGDGVIFPENAFVVNQLGGKTVTSASIEEELIKSLGYSLGALEQKGTKIVYLVADTPVKMAKVRQAFLGSSFSQKFLEDGMLVELIPQANGLFERQVVVRSSKGPGILNYTENEGILSAFGVKKIMLSGATKIVEEAGDMMHVMIETMVDGKPKTMEIYLPKGTKYGDITADLLVKYGMPGPAALWYERALIGLGGAVLVAGAILMAYDGAKFLHKAFGYGDYIQMVGDVLLDMPRELRESIVLSRLENTIVGRGKRGDSLFQARMALTARGDKSDYDPVKTSYLKSLDDRIVGLPFQLLNDQDVTLPIRVDVLERGPTIEFGDDPGKFVVTKYQYVDTRTGEKMIITYDPETGQYSKEGPDWFLFDVPAVAYDNLTGDPTVYIVPAKFGILNLADGPTEGVIPAVEDIEYYT
jgi:hypothetical protein